MRPWLRQHARALAATAAKLRRAPLSALANVLVLGVALALPTALYLALVNVQNATRTVTAAPQLTVFADVALNAAEARAIGNRLRDHAGVARVHHIDRDRALAELQEASGIAEIAEALGRNPLPDAYVVEARDAQPAALERLRKEFVTWPGIAAIELDGAWAQRLHALLGVGRSALLFFGGLLAFGLVAVTFNTVRLQILHQREEIEVATLIGATPAFIRRPFLYSGTLLGLAGGGIACGMVWLGSRLLAGPVGELGVLYGGDWQLQFLDRADAGSVLLFAAALGWLGAWLSVAGHLAAQKPD